MVNMKENLLLVSLILFIISLVLLTICFFMYHYLGSDAKFHKEFHKEPQKPFITNLQGMLAIFLLASSIVIFLIGLIVY